MLTNARGTEQAFHCCLCACLQAQCYHFASAYIRQFPVSQVHSFLIHKGIKIMTPRHAIQLDCRLLGNKTATCRRLNSRLCKSLPASAHASSYTEFMSTSCADGTLQCSFGDPDCGAHGTETASCSCTCDSGWTTYAEQDLADYKYCTVPTASTSGTNSSSNCEYELAFHSCLSTQTGCISAHLCIRWLVTMIANLFAMLLPSLAQHACCICC